MTDTGTQKIEQNRDELEDLAESENPTNWIAEALLEAAEEHTDNER